MRDVVICEPKRTAVGAFGGGFKSVPVETLATEVVKSIISSTGMNPDKIDDTIFGNCYPTMETPAIGRVVALNAGLPVTACGYQIDRRCGSGLQAVINAVLQVQSGAMDCVIAGGAESMSRASFFSNEMRWGVGDPGVMLSDSLTRGRVTAGGVNHPVPGGMIETAENLRKAYEISREDQDALALRSHQRAAAAEAAGKFAEEIVPVTVKQRKGDITIEKDEHIRHDASAESLAKLRAIRSKVDENATVTAGNASGQNDGAAACLVMTRELADAQGIKPIGRLVSWGLAGCGPEVMGIGPVPSTKAALERAGLTLADLDLIELNEAFAAQALACTKALGLGEDDHARINVNGSGISLGHPVGATGVRIMTTLLRELERREAKYGLETMCIGGGQGLAAIFERI